MKLLESHRYKTFNMHLLFLSDNIAFFFGCNLVQSRLAFWSFFYFFTVGNFQNDTKQNICAFLVSPHTPTV